MAGDVLKLAAPIVQSHNIKPGNSSLNLELSIAIAIKLPVFQSTNHLTIGLKAFGRNWRCLKELKGVSMHESNQVANEIYAKHLGKRDRNVLTHLRDRNVRNKLRHTAHRPISNAAGNNAIEPR